MKQDVIAVRGARVNNLKNVNIDIPKNQLVIMTGLSGSGKTSLAFDTIYAEGQRRYVESLNSYARQFLGGMEKPDVDSIEGLSPAIAIDQKTTSNNPRSTVGTVTEIYDYLRLLYARVGHAYCPHHGIKIEAQTLKQMGDIVDTYDDGDKLQILARMAMNQKGTHKDLFDKLRKEGYVRVKVDGNMYTLDEDITLEKNKKHTIDVIVDRIKKKEGYRTRLIESLETALKLTDGEAIVENLTQGTEKLFSSNYACPICGFSVPKLEPRLFSFNNPLGACPDCKGLGIKEEVDLDLLVPDWNLSINEGGIRYFKTAVGTDRIEWQRFLKLCEYYHIDLDKPLKDFDEEERDIIFTGSHDPITYTIVSSSGNVSRTTNYIEGVVTLIQRRYEETSSKWSKEWYASFMAEHTCPTCHGARLNEMVLSVQVGGLNIIEFTNLSIEKALEFVENLKLSEMEEKIAHLILKEIHDRLTFLNEVGLGYLTLSRRAGGLSGGEAQRLSIARAFLKNAPILILDEATAFADPDNERLVQKAFENLAKDKTVIMIAHRLSTVTDADCIYVLKDGKIAESGTHEELSAKNGIYTHMWKEYNKSVNWQVGRKGETA